MTVKGLAKLESALTRLSAELQGEPMLFPLASLAKEHADGLAGDDEDGEERDPEAEAKQRELEAGLVPKIRGGVPGK